MKSTEILNRLLEEVRINEGLRSANNKLHDDMYELRVASKSPLTADQMQDIAALLLVSNGLLLSQKITWIKEVRALTSCGLKEAKDAVEAAHNQKNIDLLRAKLTSEDPPF